MVDSSEPGSGQPDPTTQGMDSRPSEIGIGGSINDAESVVTVGGGPGHRGLTLPTTSDSSRKCTEASEKKFKKIVAVIRWLSF